MRPSPYIETKENPATKLVRALQERPQEFREDDATFAHIPSGVCVWKGFSMGWNFYRPHGARVALKDKIAISKAFRNWQSKSLCLMLDKKESTDD